MKFPIDISKFRERITLAAAGVTVDEELNRIESIVLGKTVWAAVEVKSASLNAADAGLQPKILYRFYIRKQTVGQVDFIQYHGKTLRLSVPYYEIDNKYIVFEAAENPWQIT